MTDVKWASYGGWSGPWIRGTRTYKPAPIPASWEDVLVYAVAYPEGGAWDTLVAYDGTAVTAGMFQWTLTSGRLQHLLEVCRQVASVTFNATVGALLSGWGLTLKDGIIYKGNTKLVSKEALRDQFTPPGGKTPRTGKNWDKARRSVTAFFSLFQNPALDSVQKDFFLKEIQKEATLKRPKLGGATIDNILYPDGWPKAGSPAVFPEDACRAMFWSFWQNAPRKAEEYLFAVSRSTIFAKDARTFTTKLARKFAYSTFGNWGIEKAAANNREARYTKIVNCINSQIPDKLPLKP